MSNSEETAKLEDLTPISDERRSIPLWSYIPTWWAAMIVVMIFAVGFFALYPYGPVNVIQATIALALASIFCGFLFLLNGYPGYNKGIPYTVQVRSSFGVRGGKIATVIRSLPAICWLGIATWAGGLAINVITQTLWGFGNEWAYFIVFLVINVFLAMRGITMMKQFNTVGGFILVSLMTFTLIHVLRGGGFETYEAFTYEGTWGYGFWSVFATGVACIITGALNVSDMSRHLIKSKGRRNHWVGHLAGIAPAYFYMLFLGILYGMTTGTADPVAAMMTISPSVAMGVAVMAFVLSAQISSNLTLNILPPTHTFQDISRRISWRRGVIISAIISLGTCPWILFTSEHYYTFMNVYSCFLGPIIGITLADYWVVSKQEVDVDALYDRREGSKYWYKNGFSIAAIISLIVGAVISLAWVEISWMIGLPVAFVLYVILKKVVGMERVKAME